MLYNKPINMAELALKAHYIKSNFPGLTQHEIAGRLEMQYKRVTTSNVSKSLTFLAITDQDLFDSVLHGKLAYSAAVKSMRKRIREESGLTAI